VNDAREWVIDALARMERGERNALEEMREALCALVTALKADGATREQATEEVRRIIAEPVTTEGSFRLLEPAREALIELSLYWCSEEFGRA
jgi:hypothetical protein